MALLFPPPCRLFFVIANSLNTPAEGSQTPGTSLPSAALRGAAISPARFARATVFLRDVANKQKERLRLIEYFMREWNLQEIGGSTAMVQFVDFGRDLVAELRANPSGGQIGYYLDLAKEIARLRSVKAEFERYQESVPIPARNGFCELVDELSAFCDRV